MNPYVNIIHVENLPAEFQYNDEEFQTTQEGKLFYKGKELMNCVVRIIQIISAKTHVEYRCEVYISGRMFAVMSFSYSLLKMADILPKFVLFVNGPRGSYKTSMSLILTQLERTESPKYNLKARAAGLETGYKEYKDAVMLVDDLAPTEELRERNIMQSNLELVVRAFGDGTIAGKIPKKYLEERYYGLAEKEA